MRLYMYMLCCFIHFWTYGYCDSDIQIGYKVSLAVPPKYIVGFIGRAILMETNTMEPNFKVALSVEAELNQKYSCSINVFLGDVKVWNSGHLSHFYTSEKCFLELTRNGDLQLEGPKKRIGWRTGTSGQGVERLQLLRTGNLVLVDAIDNIKWQSFNFPTDVMVWGQRLDVATRLTSFPLNSTYWYSFEIQYNKIVLYLNSGKLKYSYWEFQPTKNRNITFLQVGSRGLELFNDKHKKIAQILSPRTEPVQFLALGNKTGNLALYYYSPDEKKFEAAYRAINTSCDLPLACNPYGICTFSDECSSLCLGDCNCVAALYHSTVQECFLYGLVRGVKQVEEGNGFSYLVKVPKGTYVSHHKNSGLRKWILILVGVVDCLVVFLVLGGIAYYVIWRRRKNSLGTDNTS
ncbi:Bulb-type lectin domain [Dillenia turbinata]|uniref:Bulb-type lectin domain n=1 Tax=Dillenia turbinata TaxID=194707 RepID=A0AAN8W4S4_9MAGN